MKLTANKALDEKEATIYTMVKSIVLILTAASVLTMFFVENNFILNICLGVTLASISFLFYKQYRYKQFVDLQNSMLFMIISVVMIGVMWGVLLLK